MTSVPGSKAPALLGSPLMVPASIVSVASPVTYIISVRIWVLELLHVVSEVMFDSTLMVPLRPLPENRGDNDQTEESF